MTSGRRKSLAASSVSVVGLTIAAGIMAALHIGKVPPALPVIEQDLGLGLVGAGWVASTFNLIGATFGVTAGLAADRLGGRTVIVTALALLAVGSFVGALAPNGATLIGSRVLAGFGLLGIAVAAPRLIARLTPEGSRQLALGIWSIYVPAGFSIGLLASAGLLPQAGWRGVWLSNALLLAGFTVVYAYRTRGVKVPTTPTRTHIGRKLAAALRLPGPWLLGGCFACYALQWFALGTWLPVFLTGTLGLTAGAASLWTALVVGINVAGNLTGAWLLHRGLARWRQMLAGFVVMALCALGVFGSNFDAGPRLALAVLFSAAGGVIPAAILAGTVMHAPSPDHVATVNGFAVQGAHVGTLFGAPLLAMLVSVLDGWSAGAVLMVAMGTLGIALTLALRAVEINRA